MTDRRDDRYRPLVIRRRLEALGVPFAANDCIGEHLDDEERAAIEAAVADRMADVLDALVIDTKSDHNTRETANRVARMMVREIFAGRYETAPATTDFPNAKELDEVYTVGPIAVRSTCSHHFAPILGSAWVGVIPGSKVIGLSKFSRLVRWVMARPQIQEEAVVQLADEIEKRITPLGLAVVVKAEHSCMTWRGVKEHGTSMTTSVMRGLFRDNAAARGEFMKLIEGQRFSCR